MSSSSTSLTVREAVESDIDAVREIFLAVYGEDYPYQGFFEDWWLKRSVYTDDLLMLVAEDDESGDVLGTASVVFDIGAHSDLIGEFGRLAVHPDARGRGIGNALMRKRLEFVERRLHVGIVDNRTVHPFSQRISTKFDFAPVGFLPLKHKFEGRESIAMFARHFEPALSLRRNHPRLVPEAHSLAHVAMTNCGLDFDAIVDEEAAPYPVGDDYAIEELTSDGFASLLRIERGRVRQREIFGPMRLHYGFFKLSDRHATYLTARHTTGAESGPVAGAIGFIHDEFEDVIRVFELIVRDDDAVRYLLREMLDWAEERGVEYIEVEVSAHAPRMQRTLVEEGFLPTAYVPAMVFHEVERLDVVKMVRLLVSPDLGEMSLTDEMKPLADIVMNAFERQSVLPRIAAAMGRLALLDGLNDEQRRRVASLCRVQDADAGEVLFEKGEDADRMFIVLEGGVDVMMDDNHVGSVGPGDSLGEVAFLNHDPHSARASVGEASVLATLDRQRLDYLARRRPDIAVVLYRNLAAGLGRKLRRLDRSVAGPSQEILSK